MSIHIITVPPHGDTAALWRDATLSELQTLVGGYVERIAIDDIDVWLNEDGLATEPVNTAITTWVTDHFGKFWQTFHGTAVLTSTNHDGDLASLPDSHITNLLRVFTQCPTCAAEPGRSCATSCTWEGPQPPKANTHA